MNELRDTLLSMPSASKNRGVIYDWRAKRYCIYWNNVFLPDSTFVSRETAEQELARLVKITGSPHD